MGPICSEWYSQSIRRKIRGQYSTLNPNRTQVWDNMFIQGTTQVTKQNTDTEYYI